jgi:HD-GYP domain-containing protein (c-di-GMP phosphodiesterase class II)
MFVPANVPIKKRDLAQLAALGKEYVLTEGEPKSAPQSIAAQSTAAQGAVAVAVAVAAVVQAAAAATDDPSGSAPLVNENYTRIITLIIQLDKIFANIANCGTKNSGHTKISHETSPSIRQLWNITSALINITRSSRGDALSFVLCEELKGHDLAKSSVSTAILASAIAEKMGYSSEKITGVTAAALLHDVGMLRLPQEILCKKGELSQNEIAVIQSHTALSYQIIRNEFMYGEEVANSALQHHERWDGTGYPHRLAGHAISEDARIISIADSFEAMVSEKPYRNSMIGYNAMRMLVSSNMAHFSPDVLKIFVKVMGIYPIGSGVALSDGRIAQVTNFDGDAPLRPTVKIIALPGAKKVKDGETVELLAQKHLYITQSIDIKDF